MKIPKGQPGGPDWCLRLCAAAIFEERPRDVPHFIHEPGPWDFALARWAMGRKKFADFATYLAPRRGWGGTRSDLPDDYYIAIIAPNSPGNCHAVVMKGRDVVYDPSPEKRKRYQKGGMGIIEFLDIPDY